MFNCSNPFASLVNNIRAIPRDVLYARIGGATGMLVGLGILTEGLAAEDFNPYQVYATILGVVTLLAGREAINRSDAAKIQVPSSASAPLLQEGSNTLDV